MTSTLFRNSDLPFDQPMQFEMETPSTAESRKPLQHHSWGLTISCSRPVEEGDVIMGKDWGEDEGERGRVGPVEVPEIEIDERGWEKAMDDVVTHAEQLLNQVITAEQVSALVRRAFDMWGIVSTKADAVAWGEENNPGPQTLRELEVFAASHEIELEAAGDFDTLMRRKFA